MNEVSLKPVIEELENLFSKFNARFFADKLEKPVITVSPDHTRGAYGWCTGWKAWKAGEDEGHYKTGQIRRYKGTLYKCVQNHTSQADWTPDTASSLWSKTSDPAEEWPEWSQPVGAHDAYPKGAKVSHNSKHWISTTENNVWEPGVNGWEEVTNAV